MGQLETDNYLSRALSGIPEDFSGSLLEVPVGTGVLTMPIYQNSLMRTSPGNLWTFGGLLLFMPKGRQSIYDKRMTEDI